MQTSICSRSVGSPVVDCLNRNSPHRPLQVTEKCPECGHMEAYSKEAQVRFPRIPSTYPGTNVPHNHTTLAPERGRGFNHLLYRTYLHSVLGGRLTSCLSFHSASSANLVGASTTSVARIRPARSEI